MGDVLRTTSILPALAKKHPNSAIYWITSTYAEQIFANNPFVTSVLTRPEIYLPMLSAIQFDAVYNLEADHYSSILAATARGNKKFGYMLHEHGYVVPANDLADEWFLMGIHDGLKKQNVKTYFEHMYAYSDLPFPVFKPKIYLSEREKENTAAFIRENMLSKYKKILGINTGAGNRWPLKKWPLDNYVELIEAVHRDHDNIAIVLFGGPEETETNQKLKDSLSFEIVDAGTDNSLREFFALVNAVDVLFTPDSLAMQVGIALQKEVIVYTGPTSYAELDVFGKGEIVHSDIDCLVCYLNACDKTSNCMNTLTVENMLQVVGHYL